MSRENGKSPYIDFLTLKQLTETPNLKIKSRSSTILPILIDKTVEIYNGYIYNKLTITKSMVGYKFGEFSPTRKKFSFKKKKKRGSKNKR